MANWRRWGPILFGIGVLTVFLGIGALLFGIAWMREHVVIEDATISAADTSLDEVRKRYAGRPPLIEVRDKDVRRNDPPADAARTGLSTMHVLAWDEDEGKMVRVDLPFWLILFRGMPIDIGGGNVRFGKAGFTLNAADIERYGPGIIVDLEMSSGERALIWVE